MESREEMLRTLLDGITEFERFHDEPAQVAQQFMSWVEAVGHALHAAGMTVDEATWHAASSRISFTTDSTAFVMHMKAMKAVLLGIYHRAGGVGDSGELLDPQLLEDLQPYMQKIGTQTNGCYERGWYDACAVMLRKLVEVVEGLIIECFEANNLQGKIKNEREEYRQLGELIAAFLNETAWHVSRNAKKSLPRSQEIKELGDLAAHSRRFVANRRDIDKFAKDARIVIQELAYIISTKGGGKPQ